MDPLFRSLCRFCAAPNAAVTLAFSERGSGAGRPAFESPDAHERGGDDHGAGLIVKSERISTTVYGFQVDMT